MAKSQEPLALCFDWQAEWREHKAEEYPDDYRNTNTALALRELAKYVRSLPHDHQLLVALDTHVRVDDQETGWMASEEGSRRAGRFWGFEGGQGMPSEDDFETFLTEFVAAELDETLQLEKED